MGQSTHDLPPDSTERDADVRDMRDFIEKVSKDSLGATTDWRRDHRHPNSPPDWRTERDGAVLQTFEEPIGPQRADVPDMAKILDPNFEGNFDQFDDPRDDLDS